MSDAILLSIVLSVFLLFLAYKFANLGIAFISALGFLISGLQIYAEDNTAILPMALLMMIALVSYLVPNLKVMR